MGEFLQHVVNGISLGSVYALIAIGYSMVYGILQLINFAHGEVVMLGGVFGFFCVPVMARMGIDMTPSFTLFLMVMGVAMALCGLLGFFIERFAYRPLRNAPRINCLITAIGVSLFLQYFTQLEFALGPTPQSYPEILQRTTAASFMGVDISNLQIIVVLVSACCVSVLQWIVFKTKLGKGMRAVSESTEVAALLGVPVNQVISFTFVLGSVLAAVAGTLVALMYPKVDATMGTLLGLKAFVAAVVGGIGNLPGAVLGGLIMGLAEEFTVGYSASSFRDAIAFAILIIVLLFRPSGLMGRARVEKV